jgi:hypothetical protein
LAVDKATIVLKILARSSAWALLVGIVVLIISGWGITQTGIIYNLTGGLIDRRLADEIHRAAIIPVAFFLLAYVFVNISLMVSHKRSLIFWSTAVLLTITGAGLMAITIYMEYFRLGG